MCSHVRLSCVSASWIGTLFSNSNVGHIFNMDIMQGTRLKDFFSPAFINMHCVTVGMCKETCIDNE